MKICMILEGSYPFVLGGVSSWMHQYIQAMTEHEFVLWCIGADSKDKDKFKYKLPENVTKVHQVFLNDALVPRDTKRKRVRLLPEQLVQLKHLISGENADWDVIFEMMQSKDTDPMSLLMSKQFLAVVKDICKEKYPYVSFSDYFHTIRSMILPELYLMTMDIPQADIYHATATGYGGLLGSLAKWKYQKPFVVTEHGIYTREREEEILRAKWVVSSLRKQWIGLFYGFSNCAYHYADRVTCLFEGASRMQMQLGCAKEKIRVVANGIHYERFSLIPPRKPEEWINIAAVVRIAKIKDIKTMIYAFADLKTRMDKVRLYILGAVDDEEYDAECKSLIEMLQVSDIIFTGPVNVLEYMERFDFTILTSISEGQPLSVLESMAAARPVVTTDVGCCKELIYGRSGDELGQAGFLVPPMHREEIANAMERLCQDAVLRRKMGEIGRMRAKSFYLHEQSMQQYRDIYTELSTTWQELDSN